MAPLRAGTSVMWLPARCPTSTTSPIGVAGSKPCMPRLRRSSALAVFASSDGRHMASPDFDPKEVARKAVEAVKHLNNLEDFISNL